jgi:hypothetical protein
MLSPPNLITQAMGGFVHVSKKQWSKPTLTQWSDEELRAHYKARLPRDEFAALEKWLNESLGQLKNKKLTETEVPVRFRRTG